MSGDFSALVADVQAFGGVPVDPAVEAIEGVEVFERPREDEVELELRATDDWVEFGLPEFIESVGVDRQLIRFQDLPGNRIHTGIAALDGRLTPARGLRRLQVDGRLAPLTGAVSGRTLLVVHGTFSSGEAMVTALRGEDPALLGRLFQRYDQILTFDFPSLSQQALASALTLSRLMAAQVPGPVDVVSHSQGGLVVRYWLELLDPGRLAQTRSIFVAGTLAGTNLAAPHALRGALDHLGNVARAVSVGSSALALGIPALGAVGQVFAILQKALKFLSGAPIADAGVALIPGFHGMSRVGSNAEIAELRAGVTEAPAGYFAVAGAFSPVGPKWKFWKHFTTRVANGAADLLFPDEHDLVVDTVSQTSLSDAVPIPEARVLRFREGEHHVHHTNYFGHELVRGYLADVLTG